MAPIVEEKQLANGSDGLQVSYHHAPEFNQRFPDGLHPSRSPQQYPIPVTSDSSGSDNEQWTKQTASKTQQKRKRRIWLLLAAAAVIVLIIGGVLGGVLGSKKHAETASSPTPSGSSSSTTASASDPQQSSAADSLVLNGQRLRSTTGTWNGTGITSFLDETGTIGTLLFQDHSGTIISMRYNFDNTTSKISLSSQATTPSITAANGTALKNMEWATATGFIYQVFYVNTDGHLADTWQYSHPDGAWTPGNLSTFNLAAPTDNRPAMATVNGQWDGNNITHEGLRLFAGGTDGALHQYSFDFNDRAWWPNATHNFSDSWAYGGASVVASPGSAYRSWNRTLCTTNKAGTVQSYIQKVGYSPDVTWPTTADWSVATLSDQKAMPNSSLVLSTEDGSATSNGWTLFANESNGQLDQLTVFLNKDPDSLDAGGDFGSFLPIQTASGSPLAAMQGSDFEIVRAHAGTGNYYLYNLVFYQDEGTSLAWVLFDEMGAKVLGDGHVIYIDGKWQIV